MIKYNTKTTTYSCCGRLIVKDDNTHVKVKCPVCGRALIAPVNNPKITVIEKVAEDPES